MNTDIRSLSASPASPVAARTALVTGASGFIAKHVIARLLDVGFHVVGSVRSDAKAEAVRAAVSAVVRDPASLPGRLRFVELSLEDDRGWAEAMSGIDVLVHTASPFPIAQPKTAEELIRPAVGGAERALKFAHAAGVKRVVLTSSLAAVTFPTASAEISVDRAYDERDWTDADDKSQSPYTLSKTLAERAAWRFVREQAPTVALTTIVPGLVLGPPLDSHIGSSLATVQRLLRSKDPMLPHFGFPVVDVRDVAAAHVRSIDTAGTFGRRLIVADEFMWYTEMAAVLKAWYPERKIATTRAPNFIIRLLGLFDPTAKAIVSQLDERREASAQFARETIQLPRIAAKEALRASADFLLRHGLVEGRDATRV